MTTKTCFAYTRVSTVKQGDGVSLEAQREAIELFASRNDLTVITWFEEKETAAKRGRPVFDAVVQSLQSGNAMGLIVHKIDRSARNFSDWARIGELVDSGIDVHFAHESLDLRSRGGRLTADIQAVIAADYVRNLREECIKGMEGRLKQGYFPWSAPIGYLDQGGGKAKTLDPVRAPLVRQAFELYATGQYSFRSLRIELRRRGLTSRTGRPITQGCFENMLNNQFYTGMVVLKRTGRTYQGQHEPLISDALFDQVQALKSNKQIKKNTIFSHPYRRLIKCGVCGRSLIGERQKAHVYYRCHTVGCSKTSIRQDRFETAAGAELSRHKLHKEEKHRLQREMSKSLQKRTQISDRKAIELQMANVAARMDQLTDALLDQIIDKGTFLKRKRRLEAEQSNLNKFLTDVGKIDDDGRMAGKYLELSKSLILNYGLADPAQKARLLKIAMSNCTLFGKKLCFEPQKWLCEVETTLMTLLGAPVRDRTRTEEKVCAFINTLSLAPEERASLKPKQQPDFP
jgi:DNA invertase Pin-like site-specific DNA recombinase